MIPRDLSRNFAELHRFQERLEEGVQSAVMKFCGDNGFAYVGRSKSIESVAEKIETGRFSNWNQIDDLFACSVIIPSISHEGMVIEYCCATFDATVKYRNTSFKDPDTYRFDLTRISARLRRPPGLPDSGSLDLYKIPFEIQIRSAFEHAWLVATHPLAYKSQVVDWRRHRLASQIKAAVEHWDAAIGGFDDAARHVPRNPFPRLDRVSKVAKRVQALVKSGAIPSAIQPKDMSRFASNFVAMIESAQGKRKDWKAVNKAVEKGVAAVENYFQTEETEKIPMSVSLLQLCLGICLESDVVSHEFKDYHCHVTEELMSLYPATKKIEDTFVY